MSVLTSVRISIACGHAAAQADLLRAELTQCAVQMGVETGTDRCTFLFASDKEKIIALLSFATMWGFFILDI